MHPNLKVVVPHCGSFLPTALPRFRSLLPVMVKQGIMQSVDVDAQLARLYYDLAGAPTDDATEVGRTSMATEPGVLTLFSMQDKANQNNDFLEVSLSQKNRGTPHRRPLDRRHNQNRAAKEEKRFTLFFDHF